MQVCVNKECIYFGEESPMQYGKCAFCDKFMAERHEYRTEDGVTLKTGDAAYNYYSMKPGYIGADAGIAGANQGWFDFYHSDGTRCLLNGQRICTMAFARNRGFKGA